MQRAMPQSHARGRPRTTWLGNIKHWTGLALDQSLRKVEDRAHWKILDHSATKPWSEHVFKRQQISLFIAAACPGHSKLKTDTCPTNSFHHMRTYRTDFTEL